MLELILMIFALFSYLFYVYVTKVNKYWLEKGVPFVKPVYIFGNFAKSIFRLNSFVGDIEDIYYKYPNHRYVGLYQPLKHTFMIRDPELIKRITVKDFDAFSDHNQFIPADVDPLWSKNLLFMSSNDGWQEMRATLSPSFTASKMRLMFTLMQDCSKQFINYLRQVEGTKGLEMKSLFSKLANDVIGSTAFGITCNSLQDENNDFYLMGKEVTNFSGLRGLAFFAYNLCPSVMKILKVRIINNRVGTYFRGVIKESLKFRQEKKIVRPDMIHLLMEARKGRVQEDKENIVDTGFAVVNESDIIERVKKNKLELSDEDITAQALIFFLAGFDTVSSAMSYISYELAINADVQEKLHAEIKDTLKNNKGNVTYENVLSMKYLDNVLSETLRLHTPVGALDRKCVKPFVIEAEKPGETPVHIERNTVVWIPVRSIHTDPKYYPNPKKFDPDRFNDENKHNIQPFTYMPFGLGPRNCIGSRFALLECKLMMVELLLNYELVPVEKTEIPITLSRKSPVPLPANGIWIGIIPRK